MPDIFVSKEKHIQNIPPLPEKFPKTEFQKKHLRDHKHNRFSAFNLYPDNIDFETKEKQEKIILMLGQHPIANLKWISVTLLLLITPAILGYLGIFSFLPEGFALIIHLAWYLVTSAYAIEGFFNWYFNVYFVTTDGVIDVDFFNLLDKRVSEADLDKIQDVSYSTRGVMGTLFNYGNVQIQTAAEITEFMFELVPNPEQVAKMLDELIDKTVDTQKK